MIQIQPISDTRDTSNVKHFIKLVNERDSVLVLPGPTTLGHGRVGFVAMTRRSPLNSADRATTTKQMARRPKAARTQAIEAQNTRTIITGHTHRLYSTHTRSTSPTHRLHNIPNVAPTMNQPTPAIRSRGAAPVQAALLPSDRGGERRCRW